MNWKLCLFVGLIGYGAYNHLATRQEVHGPGETAKDAPLQTPTTQAPFAFKQFTITPLNEFSIEARALSIEHYQYDAGSAISPIDITFGWGPMSDEAILNNIKISQTNRFYYWHVDTFPIPRNQIETHSANMHLIPENAQIENTLNKVRIGKLVTIKGFLVRVDGKNGYYWKSSQSRDDTGAGACELIYVKSVTIN